MNAERKLTTARILLSLLMFSLSFSLYAQQPDPVRMEISPNPVGKGDRFGITILLDIEDPSMIEVAPPRLSEEIVLLRGPYIRPVWTSVGDEEQRKLTEITYLYRCDDAGRFEIGPYRIVTPGRIFSTMPDLLEVGVYQNRELVIPLETEWDIQPATAYVGQNVICILKALEQRDIRIFDDTRIEPPSEGFFQPAEGVGEIRKFSRGGIELYEIPVESYVFTPSSTGNVMLPRARVNWENGQSVSNRALIEVKPLPEAVLQSGAVGDFTLQAEVDRTELNTGRRINLTVRISGTGNLNYLQFPEIETPAFTLLETDERLEYRATARGYQGWRQYTYTLLAEQQGPANILVKSLTAFNPAEEKIYFSPGKSFPIQITAPLGKQEEESSTDGFPFAIIEQSEMERVYLSFRFSDWVEYLWLLPGPVVFVFFLLLRRRKAVFTVLLLFLLSFSPLDFIPDSTVERLTSAEEAYSNGDYLNAELLYEELLSGLPDVPALHYNAALSAYQQEKIGKAVFHTRCALVQKPMDQKYKRFLNYINDYHGVVTQFDLPFSFHPDFFLFLLTFSLNAAGFSGVFYLFKRRNSYFIVGILLLVVSIVLSIAMSYSVYSSGNRTAVVMTNDSDEYEVKKIPKTGSEADFILQPGETVHIQGGTEQFYFITTSLGQKGWVLKPLVRIVPGIAEFSLLSSETDVTLRPR